MVVSHDVQFTKYTTFASTEYTKETLKLVKTLNQVGIHPLVMIVTL